MVAVYFCRNYKFLDWTLQRSMDASPSTLYFRFSLSGFAVYSIYTTDQICPMQEMLSIVQGTNPCMVENLFRSVGLIRA